MNFRLRNLILLSRINTLFVFISFLFFVGSMRAINYDGMHVHPRLLMHEGQENEIKAAVGQVPELKRIYDYIISESDKLFVEPTLTYDKRGRRLLHVSREALRRIFYLSFAYRMTDNIAYATRAEQEIKSVCSFTNWNPVHFLDVGEMTMAVAIGYDWLYDVLSDDTKDIVAKSIIDKGFVPSKDDRYNNFLSYTSNWNQVCNSGLVYGALSIYEDYPKESEEIIERALQTIVKSMKGYAPDGNYPEGYNYWGYGTTFNVFLIAALQSSLGIDGGLINHPGFLESARYIMYMAGTANKSFNYSDSGSGVHGNPVLFWFALYLNDPSLLSYELQYLQNSQNSFTNEEKRFLPLALIYGSKLDLKNISKPSSKVWSGDGVTPVVLVKTNWENGKGCYLGMKGGSPSTSHSHMDGGSFIFEHDGTRWAIDLGSDSYDKLEANKIDLWNRSQDGQRWELFRYNNFAHNTISINDELHKVNGNAVVVKTIEKKSIQGGVMDLTSLFGDDIKKVERECLIINNSYLKVTDKIECGNMDANVRWTMVTAATPKVIKNNIVELRQKDKVLNVIVDSPRDAHFEILENIPKFDCESRNDGTQRIVFNTIIKKNKDLKLVVRLVPVE